jgi:hypothetical protein
MKLRYSAVAAALVGLLLPSITMAQPEERYWGPGMMWGGGLFHMFFGFLMMILFLAIVVGVGCAPGPLARLGALSVEAYRPNLAHGARHPEGAARQGRDRCC